MSDPAPPSEKTADERASVLLDGLARMSTSIGRQLSAVMIDLFRPEGERLSDLERTTMRHLLDQVVGAAEDELRSRILARKDLRATVEFEASLGAPHVPIARPILDRVGLLRDPELVGALLRRTKDYALIGHLRRLGGTPEPGGLDELPSRDGEIGRAAMALLIAESRRNDRFEEPALARADLPAAVERRLVWRVAAALREYGVRQHGLDGNRLDAVIAGEAGDMLVDRESAGTLEAAAGRLADLLEEAGLAHDELLVEALFAGRPALYFALLARRASLSHDAVRELASAVEGHLVILRAAGTGREAALRLALVLHEALGGEAEEHSAAAWAEAFDALSRNEAAAAVRPWLFDSGYRAALAELAGRSDGGWQ